MKQRERSKEEEERRRKGESRRGRTVGNGVSEIKFWKKKNG